MVDDHHPARGLAAQPEEERDLDAAMIFYANFLGSVDLQVQAEQGSSMAASSQDSGVGEDGGSGTAGGEAKNAQHDGFGNSGEGRHGISRPEAPNFLIVGLRAYASPSDMQTALESRSI